MTTMNPHTDVTAQNRSMTLLNSLGDVTIVWTAENDAAMKDMIRDKLAKGIRFFLVKKIPLVPLYRRATVTDPDALPNNVAGRRVDLTDKDLERLVASGTVTLSKIGTDTVEFLRATKDVDEIAKSDTAALPQMVGG